MVFSSLPAYLDPSNWQQQPNHHQIGNSGSNLNHSQLISPPPQSVPAAPLPQPPYAHVGGGTGTGSIRPGSMAERARLANMPMPETALKCPRCESTNTKFCYFNNYSLSQPRHFCKTCRRYWTRGGALRSVPVGGGCRRNKRSKRTSSSSKSPVSSSDRQTTSSNSTSTINSSNGTTGAAAINLLAGLTPHHQIPPPRFLSPLSQLSAADHYLSSTSAAAHDIIGLNSYSAPVVGGGGGGTREMGFQLGGGNSGLLGGGVGSCSLLSSGSIEQWRLQQQLGPSFFGGLESSSGLNYVQFNQAISPLEPSSGSGFVGESSHHQLRPSTLSTSELLTQMASVKVEENQAGQELNFSRQLMMGINPSTTTNVNDQWTTGAAAWTDLTSFTSSSTSNRSLLD